MVARNQRASADKDHANHQKRFRRKGSVLRSHLSDSASGCIQRAMCQADSWHGNIAGTSRSEPRSMEKDGPCLKGQMAGSRLRSVPGVQGKRWRNTKHRHEIPKRPRDTSGASRVFLHSERRPGEIRRLPPVRSIKRRMQTLPASHLLKLLLRQPLEAFAVSLDQEHHHTVQSSSWEARRRAEGS